MLGNTNSVQGVVQIGLTGKSDRSATVGFIVGADPMVPVDLSCAARCSEPCASAGCRGIGGTANDPDEHSSGTWRHHAVRSVGG